MPTPLGARDGPTHLQVRPMRRVYEGHQMNLNQGALAQGLVDELLEVVHKYDESLYMSTVIGVLELVKQQLINESLEDAE
jgi:hypothetical protein